MLLQLDLNWRIGVCMSTKHTMTLIGLMIRILAHDDNLNLLHWHKVKCGEGIALRWVNCFIGTLDDASSLIYR